MLRRLILTLVKAVDKLFADLAELKIESSGSLNYTSDVFVGAAVTLSKDSDVEVIEALPQIEKIWPVYDLPPPKPIDGKVVAEALDSYNIHVATGVQKLHDEGIKGEGVIIAIVDTGVDYNHPDLGGGFGPGFKVESGWDFLGDGKTESYHLLSSTSGVCRNQFPGAFELY